MILSRCCAVISPSVYCPTSSLIRQCHHISLPQLVLYVYGDDWRELLCCIPLRVHHPRWCSWPYRTSGFEIPPWRPLHYYCHNNGHTTNSTIILRWYTLKWFVINTTALDLTIWQISIKVTSIHNTTFSWVLVGDLPICAIYTMAHYATIMPMLPAPTTTTTPIYPWLRFLMMTTYNSSEEMSSKPVFIINSKDAAFQSSHHTILYINSKWRCLTSNLNITLHRPAI